MDAQLNDKSNHGHGAALLRFSLGERRRLVEQGNVWFELAASLAADLDVLKDCEAPIPTIKARLTRVGGRCALDGTQLGFDPFSPFEHACPRCGTIFTRKEDHEWWAMGANLWTAERAVHAAALNLLNPNVSHEAIASDILAGLSRQYLQWPNRDNVLGPTRPFFSTYLESIWLLNICHAVSLLEASNAERSGNICSTVRERIVEPSLALISSYDEGMSNRQVWNEVAILSALRVLGMNSEFDERVSHGGLTRLIGEGLLDDGSWYEGENYHQFAHRGLWYGVQLFAAVGIELPSHLQARFARGYVTPFQGVLPDETFPSRRDSQYRVSIRQWRFAEWCELGLTFRYDSTLAGVRQTLYDGSVPRIETGRSRSTADAERNTPASALTRADCSWRALLMADGAPLGHEFVRTPSSVLLVSQGLSVIRRDGGKTYVALEGGHTGGGHGHPDQLALTLQYGEHRILEDPGTGSYVEPSLHWYRSTLAHFAPLVDRKSQQRSPAQLVAFEDRGGVGWMVKRARIADGVIATRTVVVCDGYLVDLLEWTCDGGTACEITLPLCGTAHIVSPVAWQSETVASGGGLEDGFDFINSTAVANLPGVLTFGVPVPELIGDDSYVATCNAFWEGDGQVVRAIVPGPPGTGAAQRHWLRLTSSEGRVVSVWNWKLDGATEVTAAGVLRTGDGVVSVTTGDGTTAVHRRTDRLWHIDYFAAGARSSVDLGESEELPGVPPPEDVVSHIGVHSSSGETVSLSQGQSRSWQLGERHYMRTEEDWHEAGRPTAEVTVQRDAQFVHVIVRANTGPVVVNEHEVNPLDNERADVNSDGLQLYFGSPKTETWSMGWLIVPLDSPRITALFPSPPVDVRSAVRDNGWEASFRIDVSDLPLGDGYCRFNLIVNERPPGRERRRGQLVLTGGNGFSYLRGDRHDPGNALLLDIG